MNQAQTSKTRILVECGIMMAFSMALSYVKIWEMPMGGSVTALSMLPLVLLGYKYGLKWGLTAGVAFGLMQLMFQANYLVGLSAFSVVVAVFFDYIFAFGALGLSGLMKGKKGGFAAGAAIAVFARFLCHFVVGFAVWAAFADQVAVEGMNPVLYSFLYNIAYMGPEFITTTAAAFVMQKSALSSFLKVPGGMAAPQN
ncbi:MAG TPA: energy-coupled thiamine transporter ThiT [Terriglobales bacterium]|nr:energy-coupled thiamine transporter ThiT [Terriglobales bacterium]